MTQLVGRILRQPEAIKTEVSALDECHVITHRTDTATVVEAIKDGLKKDGLGSATPEVDTDATLERYLENYVHELQGLVLDHPSWSADELNAYFANVASGLGQLFTVSALNRTGDDNFEVTISVPGPTSARVICVSQHTNAGMRKFSFEAGPVTWRERTPEH